MVLSRTNPGPTVDNRIMSWLSLYGLTQTDESNAQIKLWRGWTNEEKAYVVKEAFDNYYINSDDIRGYLATSRLNTVSNLLFPVATFLLYHNLLQKTLFKRATAKTAGGVLCN